MHDFPFPSQLTMVPNRLLGDRDVWAQTIAQGRYMELNSQPDMEGNKVMENTLE